MESVAYILILALAIGVLFFSIAFREPPRFEKKEKQVIYSLINWEYMLIISVVTDDSSNGYFDLGIKPVPYSLFPIPYSLFTAIYDMILCLEVDMC